MASAPSASLYMVRCLPNLSTVGPTCDGLKLLCLDGGGARGLSSLYILKQLMEAIDIENPPRPCECFHMIAGTSTGGLIAIMLGRLRMKVDRCIEVYKRLSPEIFTKVHHRLKISGKVQGRFNHEAIENGVKELLRDEGLGEEELMYEQKAESCKTFVCATSKQTGCTVVLSSYLNPRRGRDMADIARIWQVARATSAATSFFDPIEIGDEQFVDGATPANNPIMELWSEASDMFRDLDDPGWTLEDKLSCIVSVGTGVPVQKTFGDDPVEIGSRLLKIATDTEGRACAFIKQHPGLHQKYFRFNVDNGLQDVKLEEAGKQSLIVAAARDYIQKEDVHSNIKECSRMLSTDQSFASWYRMAMSLAMKITVNFHHADGGSHAARESNTTTTDIGWFTHTRGYKHWFNGEGGCIFYSVRESDAAHRAMTLVAGLPKVWKRVAYLDGDVHTSMSPFDILTAIICQILLSKHDGNISTWEAAKEVLGDDEQEAITSLFKARGSASDYKRILDALFCLGIHRSGPPTSISHNVLFIARNLQPFHNFQLFQNLQPFHTFEILHGLFQSLQSLHNPELFHDPFLSASRSLRLTGSFTKIHLLVAGDLDPFLGDSNLHLLTFSRIDEDTEYKECLEDLKFQEMDTRQNQVSQPLVGTSHWVWQHASFKRWEGGQSGVLWIQGKPGSGKSVLAKSIVTAKARDDDQLIASWFYSRRGGTVGTSHKSMIRSISHQLLSQSRVLFDRFTPLYRESGLNIHTFIELLKMSPSSILCVLDGLDESADRETEGRTVLKLLAEATEQPSARIKLIVLSRLYRAIEEEFAGYDIRMQDENEEDIKAVAEEGIRALIKAANREEAAQGSFAQRRRSRFQAGSSRTMPSEQFMVQNIAYQERETEAIKCYLLDHAQGVMLWVKLCIDYAIEHASKTICTWKDIRQAIEALPRTLRELYLSIVSELPACADPKLLAMARRVLAWITVASSERPLELGELMDAISIPRVDEPADWDTAAECPLQRPIFSSWEGFARDLHDLCGPLIEVTENPSSNELTAKGGEITSGHVVQLLHQTVKEFLEGGEEHPFQFTPHQAGEWVRDDSRAYLRLVLPLQTRPYTPALEAAGEHWEDTVLSFVRYLADKFLLRFILGSPNPNDCLAELRSQIAATIDNPDANTNWWIGELFRAAEPPGHWDLEAVKQNLWGRILWLCQTPDMRQARCTVVILSSLQPRWTIEQQRRLIDTAFAMTHHSIKK